MQPCVELQSDSNFNAGQSSRSRNARCHLQGVHCNRDPDPFGEFRQSHPLLFTPERINNEDVIDARVRHNLRLTELGDCNSGRTILHLEASNLRYLVGLGVRTKREIVHAAIARHPAEVSAQRVDIDKNCRCV